MWRMWDYKEYFQAGIEYNRTFNFGLYLYTYELITLILIYLNLLLKVRESKRTKQSILGTDRKGKQNSKREKSNEDYIDVQEKLDLFNSQKLTFEKNDNQIGNLENEILSLQSDRDKMMDAYEKKMIELEKQLEEQKSININLKILISNMKEELLFIKSINTRLSKTNDLSPSKILSTEGKNWYLILVYFVKFSLFVKHSFEDSVWVFV